MDSAGTEGRERESEEEGEAAEAARLAAAKAEKRPLRQPTPNKFVDNLLGLARASKAAKRPQSMPMPMPIAPDATYASQPPEQFVKTLLKLARESMKPGLAATRESTLDSETYGQPLVDALASLDGHMSKASRAAQYYNPEAFLDVALGRIKSELKAATWVYGNTDATQPLADGGKRFKIRFAIKLREVMEKADLPAIFISDDIKHSDAYVNNTLSAFKSWVATNITQPAMQRRSAYQDSIELPSRSWFS